MRNASWRVGSVAVAVALIVAASPAVAAPLLPLEVVDPVYEDVVVPEVFGPTAEALEPTVDGVTSVMRHSTIGVISQIWGIGTTFPYTPGHSPVGEIRSLVPRDVVPGNALPGPSIFVWAELVRPDFFTMRRGYLIPDVPLLMDLSRDAVPDLLIEARWATGTPQLRITRLPTAPAEFPARLLFEIDYGDPDRPYDPDVDRFFVDPIDGQFPDLVTVPLQP